MALNLQGRALHYLFKIGDRKQNLKFFKDILGMQVLRHDELPEGSPALCNGPYPGPWSKTMVGYGDEDTHFLLELIHNYGVDSYEMGNDYCGTYITSSAAIANAKAHNWPTRKEGKYTVMQSPDGYTFFVSKDAPGDPLKKVVLASSNLNTSIKYFHEILGLKMFKRTDTCASFGFDEKQAKLVLMDIGCKVEHKSGNGRYIYSIPRNQQQSLDDTVRRNGYKVLIDPIELGTPGKATVVVTILYDPDEHEIAFVGDEGFRALSAYNPRSEQDLLESIQKHGGK